MAKIKQGDKDYLEDHSKAKVEFLEKYLNMYLTILFLASYKKSINIYDIFCGVGIYSKDGSKGSPVLAMECINNNLKKYGTTNISSIELLINDGDKRKVDIAQNFIEKICQKFCSFNAYNLQAKDIFQIVKTKIIDNKKSHHFIFIDPHGYKEIFKHDIIDIMDKGKSEILIFLPIHRMYSFSKAVVQDDNNPSFVPLKRFMKEFDLNHNSSSPNEYIKFLAKSFTFNDKYYTTSYILESDTKNKYALFFITKHLKGLEKAVETKWKLDDICGNGFEQKKAPSLFDELNQEERKEDCFSVLLKNLREFLKTERNNNEIFEFILKQGFLPKHAIAILKKLKLKFDRDIRKNAYYLSYDYYHKPIKYKVILDG